MSGLKVKPCPFCGSDDISFSAFSLSPDAYALCEHCNAGIEIQVGWGEMTEKEHDEVCNLELQKVWNRRAVEQPQLNENQQQVFGWLKEYYKENRPFTTAFGAIRNVASKRWAFIKQNLTEDQQEYVLEAFSRWALEQEEE